ncbi:MAG: hypothetical protein U0892_14875 [Pirellulales bacterium]
MNRVFLAGIVGFALVLSAGLFVGSENASAGCGCNGGLLAGLKAKSCGGGVLAKLKAPRDCSGSKLLAKLHDRLASKSCCGEPAPACGCEAPAPACGCAAPAPACGCAAPAPACGCGAPAPCSACGSSVNAGSIQVESASPSNAPAPAVPAAPAPAAPAAAAPAA